MVGFFVGWGVFWLLTWLAALLIGYAADNAEMMGFGMLGAIISAIYLIAVIIGIAITYIT
jgi:hypothetical protein